MDIDITCMAMRKTLIIALWILLPGLTSLHAQTAVKDADGNTYMAIVIGKQTWMAENLKATRLNDGTPIKLVTDEKAWAALNSPGCCYYDNDPKNKEVYGVLYNWFTVDTKKLCPKGWHVPSDDDWKVLTDKLGDLTKAGDKLKEAGTSHWKNYFSQATNEYDFTALPAGMRYNSGFFPDFGNDYAVWWSSTRTNNTLAWNRGLHNSTSRLFRGCDEIRSGFSVRCIMDKK